MKKIRGTFFLNKEVKLLKSYLYSTSIFKWGLEFLLLILTRYFLINSVFFLFTDKLVLKLTKPSNLQREKSWQKSYLNYISTLNLGTYVAIFST